MLQASPTQRRECCGRLWCKTVASTFSFFNSCLGTAARAALCALLYAAGRQPAAAQAHPSEHRGGRAARAGAAHPAPHQARGRADPPSSALPQAVYFLYTSLMGRLGCPVNQGCRGEQQAVQGVDSQGGSTSIGSGEVAVVMCWEAACAAPAAGRAEGAHAGCGVTS